MLLAKVGKAPMAGCNPLVNMQNLAASAPVGREYVSGLFRDGHGKLIKYSTPGTCAGCNGARDEECEKVRVRWRRSDYIGERHNNSAQRMHPCQLSHSFCNAQLDEPTILCDGNMCTREYHLRCANLDCVPESEFFCFDCCPMGASKVRQTNERIDDKD